MSDKESRRETEARLSLEGVEQDLRVIQFEAAEGLNRLYEITVVFASPAGAVDEGAILGQTATLDLEAHHGPREFHGMVSQVTRLQGSPTRGQDLHSLVISPRAWRLTRGSNYRVFSKMSVLDMAGSLLDAAKVPHRVRTYRNQAPRRRDLTIQYGESDWAFICRLFQEEGFFFTFAQGDASHTLEVMDHPSLAPQIARPGTLDLRAPHAAMATSEQAFAFSFSRELRTGRVVLDDYNPDRPALGLRVISPEPEDNGGDEDRRRPDERFHYPGDYPLAEQGKVLARTRREAEEAAAAGGEGRSDCPRLAAGSWFTLRAADGGETEYMLTEVHHVGRKATDELEGGAQDRRLSYDNRFSCVERAAPYRPPRVNPRPSVQGVQTAVVVGAGNEEISTDKQGRVMVRFRWDRLGATAGECSCWVRVSQVMAGAGWGSIWIPRAGQEVVVSFEQGNPDRPLVTGCLYHAHHLPPFGLPKQKTRSGFRTHSTPGGNGYNELSFEDRAGAEVVRLRAQRDLRERVGADHTTTVRRNQSITVEQGDRSVGVLAGDLLEDVAGQRVSNVIKDRAATIQQGDDRLTIQKGNRTVTLEDGNHTMLVSGSALTRTRGGSYTVEVDGPTFSVRCGKSELLLERDGTISLVGSSIQLRANGGLTFQAGSAVDVTGETIKLNG